MQHFVYRMLFPVGLYRLKRGNVFVHGHNLRVRQLLDQCITFLMIAMCVRAKQDLHVGELESQLSYGLLNRWHVSFVCTVNKDISLRSSDEEGTQCFGPNVIDVADDFVRWKLRLLVGRRAHVSSQYRFRGVSTALNGYCGMIRRS